MKRSLIALLTLACAGAGIAALDQDQVDRRYRSLIETERRFAGNASGYLRVWLHAPDNGWRILIDVVTAG